MRDWDIRVDEATQVLGTAQRTAQQYDDDVATVRDSVVRLDSALPRSPHLVARVHELAHEVLMVHLQQIRDETTTAFEGTLAALRAYRDGDLEMAQHSWSASTRVTSPDARGGPGRLAHPR